MLAHARTGRGTTQTYNLDHSATKSATHVHHSCSTHGYHLCSPNSSQTHHNIHNILLLQFWHATPVQADQMTYHSPTARVCKLCSDVCSCRVIWAFIFVQDVVCMIMHEPGWPIPLEAGHARPLSGRLASLPDLHALTLPSSRDDVAIGQR